MAAVYLAEDERLGRRVAVKRLHADSPDDAARRFRREARIGAALNHANLVSIFDTVTDDEGLLIVMEYVEGGTLASALKQGPLSPEETLRVLRGVSAALDRVHALGVIHRDVKPANVLLADTGEVKLADLGIATATEVTRITRSGVAIGTPSYMAPEQAEAGESTAAVDVYALAAMAFEALGGKPAVTGDSPLAVVRRAATGPRPDLREAWPQAPARAAEVLRGGLAIDPTERPASAGQLVDELDAALAEQQPEADPATKATASQQAASGLGAAGAAAAGAAGAGIAAGRSDEGAALEDTPATQDHGQEAVAGPPPDSGASEDEAEPSPDSDGPPVEEGPPMHTDADRAASPGERRPPLGPAPVSSGTGRPRRLVAAALGALLAGLAVATAILVLAGGDGTPDAGDEESPAAQEEGGTTEETADPAETVQSFYQLAAEDQYREAWSLASPALREQLAGFEAWRRSQSTLESIEFPRAETVSEDDESAVVEFATVATHTGHVDRCTGTADLVRAGNGWQLSGLSAVTCDRS